MHINCAEGIITARSYNGLGSLESEDLLLWLKLNKKVPFS